METNLYSYLLESGKKYIAVVYNTTGETHITRTLERCYPTFLVGHSRHDVDFETLLPGLSTLEIFYRSGTFWTHHELERDIRNVLIQMLEETRLELKEKMQSIYRTLLEASYDFMMIPLIHTETEIIILTLQGVCRIISYP